VQPTRYLEVVRRGWAWILLGAICGLAASGLYSSTKTPLYTATTSVFFSVSGGDSVTQLLQGSTFSQNQVSSYALLVKQPAVLQPVIDQLKLPTSPSQLAAQITTASAPDTVILNISVSTAQAKQSADVANAVGAQLGKTVATLSAGTQPGAAGLTVKATTVATAAVPSKPSSPKLSRNLAAGLVGGLGLGIAFVLMRELLNTKVRAEEDVKRVDDDVSVLGVIGHDPSVKKQAILPPGDRGARAESLRRLQSNLEYLNYEGRLRTLVVTSPLPNEGKTITTGNLALTMAESQRVLLIDADLRNPSVAQMFGIDGSIGLSTILSGRVSIEDAIQHWGRGRLDIIPAGHIPPNPSQLLGSTGMADMLSMLTAAGKYDLVLMDTAPILPVSDSTVLSKYSDGAIIIVNAKSTTRSQLAEALRSFARSGARTLGVVLNNADGVTSGYYYGSYGQEPGTKGTTSEVSANLEKVIKNTGHGAQSGSDDTRDSTRQAPTLT